MENRYPWFACITRPGAAAKVATLFVCVSAARAIAATESIDAAQKAVTDWIAMRAETVKLDSDWTAQKRLLETSIVGLNDRAETVEAECEHIQVQTREEQQELSQLAADNASASKALAAMEAETARLRAEIEALRPALPPRLVDGLSAAFASFGNKDQSVGDRAQVVMSILNRCTQFNRTVTAGEETLDLAGSPDKRLVETLYWGLAQGIALDRGRQTAWLGRPENGRWEWREHREAFASAARLLEIYRDKQEPAFVQIPVQID